MRNDTSTKALQILFLGNANNPLLINLAIELRKIRPVITIDIVSESPVTNQLAKTAFGNITFIPEGKFFRSIPVVKTIWMAGQFRKALASIRKEYDVVHMFFLHVGYTKSVKLLDALAPKFIVSVFGSELYRSPEIVLKQLEKLAGKADVITAANSQTLLDFRKRFQIQESKCVIRRFGLRPLDNLKALAAVDKRVHKRAVGIDEDKFVITCGYNASRGQQHEAIIESLGKHITELPPNYLLLFPLASGGDVARREQIRSQLTTLGLKYQFITEYLSDENLAHLRAATDIMIQVQTSDQLSGAMQEHMYAGNVVITGAWLPYEVLRESGVVYWTVRNADEVGAKVCELVQHFKSHAVATSVNAQAIWQLSSWELNAQTWMELYV